MTGAGNPGLRGRDGAVVRNSVPLLPVSEPEAIVTLEMVNALRDELMVTRTNKTDAPIVGQGT